MDGKRLGKAGMVILLLAEYYPLAVVFGKRGYLWSFLQPSCYLLFYAVSFMDHNKIGRKLSVYQKNSLAYPMRRDLPKDDVEY